MKNIIANILKTLFFSYTFYLMPFNINIFYIIMLTFYLSLTNKYYSLIQFLVLLFFKEYLLSIIIIALILQVVITKLFILRNKHITILSYTLISLLSSFIYFYYNYFELQNIYIICGFISSLFIFIILINNTILYRNNKKSSFLVLNENLKDIVFLSVSYASILLTNTNTLLLLSLMLILLSFISKRETLVLIMVLVLTLNYLYIDVDYTISLIIIFMVLMTRNLITSSVYIVFLLYSNLTNLIHYDLETIVSISLISIFLFIFYKNEIINKSRSKTTTLIDNYIKYLDISYNNLIESSNNQRIDFRVSEVIDYYCKNCSRFNECTKNSSVLYSFLRILLLSEQCHITVQSNDDIKNYAKNCLYYEEICSLEKIEILNNYSYESILESKKIMSNILNKIKTEEDYSIYDRFIDILKSVGYIVSNYEVITFDKLFELYIEIENVNKSKLENVILSYASSYFKDQCAVTIIKESLGKITFKLYYKSNIKLVFEHAQLAKGSKSLTGDNYLVKRDIYGRYIFALSDGMGSGFSAFNMSSELLNLVRSIFGLNFDINTSLDLLDSYYSFKKNDESFATLDLLFIDGVNKNASLYKLGSTNTYLFSKGRLKTFYNSNLPLGINSLKEKHNFELYKQDLIIMLSDGVTEHINNEELENLLLKVAYRSVDRIVQDVIDYTINTKNKTIKDDISVIAIKVV